MNCWQLSVLNSLHQVVGVIFSLFWKQNEKGRQLTEKWEYNDFLNNLISKKQLTEADLKASKLYNVQVWETILQNIKIVISLIG